MVGNEQRYEKLPKNGAFIYQNRKFVYACYKCINFSLKRQFFIPHVSFSGFIYPSMVCKINPFLAFVFLEMLKNRLSKPEKPTRLILD